MPAFSFGSLGGGSNLCCCTGCNLEISTSWCGITNKCVAPGTITVELRSGTITGPVVSSGTADATGVFTAKISSTGNYWASASTTSSGYSNRAAFINIVTVPTSGNCTPSVVRTPLFPTQLTFSNSVLGTLTLLPTGAPTGAPIECTGVTGSELLYQAIGTAATTAHCPPCLAQSNLKVLVSFEPCGAIGQPTNDPIIALCFDVNNDNGIKNCPGDGISNQADGSLPVALTGVGPNQSACYPVNLSGSGSIAGAGGGPASEVFGSCSDLTIAFTVTQ